MFVGAFIDFINKFAKEYKIKLILLSMLSTIAASFEFIGLSLIYAFVVLLSTNNIYIPYFSDIEIFQNQTNIALTLGIFVALAYILKDLFMVAHINFQNSLLTDISNDIFKKNYAKFISQNYFSTRKLPSSDKLRILDNSIITIVNGFMGAVLFLFANSIVAFVIILYLFIKFQLNALIISIFIFAIWYLENKYFKNKSQKHGELLHIAERKKYNFVLSTINAQKDIIIYNKKNAFEHKAYDIQKKYSKQKQIITTNSQLPNYFTEIGVMGIFVIFVTLMLNNGYSGAQLSASLATIAVIVIRIVPAINKTQYCLQAINTSKYEVKWFYNVINSLYENQTAVETSEKLSFKDFISFKNISFCYEKNTYALKNINFEIKRGDFIGITGVSGSGKSTLFNIICALFTPKNGEIYIDNTKLTKENIKMWQNNISILSQEFSLPFKTVWQNVTLEPDETKKTNIDEIIKALEYANIYDEINKDIEKDVEELSCGQKHRVALARAFYFKRDVIMLDEATSALDVQAEAQISKSIEKIKGQKTIIAIAHRLSTLKNCDKIIYMDKGKIVDTGSFSELEKKHPSFGELVRLSKF